MAEQFKDTKNLWGKFVVEDVAPLEDKFTVSPFTVLDARRWQDRKRMWTNDVGIRGEEGRDSDAGAVENIVSAKWNRGQATEADVVPGGGGPGSVRRKAPKDLGRCFGQDLIKGENPNFSADYAANHNDAVTSEQQSQLGVYNAPGGSTVERAGGGAAGTSIFDPVLCEIGYRWFAPKGGTVLDPFAGGSTRGIVAECLGLKYTGIELRQGQIDANVKQAAAVGRGLDKRRARGMGVPFHNPNPNWICGDSSELDYLLPFGEEYDLLFTCPPYFDLEIYSGSDSDGSAKKTYTEFMAWYENIFAQAVNRLKHNRFAFVTVGDVRDRDSELGTYLHFVHDTAAMFKRLGLHFYNQAILVTSVGSLPVRINKQFSKYRKLGMTHQQVLVFWKGDENKLAVLEALGELAKSEMGDESGNEK